MPDVSRTKNFGRDVVDTWAQTRPDATALYIVSRDRDATRISFADMRRISNRTASFFRQQGISRGDRVLVVLGKHPAFWPVMIGLLKVGAVAMPGTTQLSVKDLAYRLEASGSRHAVVLDSVAERVDQAARDMVLRVTVDGDRPGWHQLDPYGLTAGDGDGGNPTQEDDPALIFFTSGTTGMPKMVLHDQRYPEAHRITAEYWIGLKPDDLHWNISDTGWAKAAWSSLFGPWTMGSAIVVDDMTGKFSARDMLNILSRHPITSVCAPPTVYRLLVQENLSQYRFSNLRSLVSAGEPLNPEVIETVRQTTGITVRDGYGQTETVLLVGNSPDSEVRPGSMGKPAPVYTMSIIDQSGQQVPDGQEGDIALRWVDGPPGLFREYVGDPEATRSRFIGEWYITGDRAIRDSDGYFYFVGRSDDVIISAGYRIGPFEVESLLIEHPDVVEAAVVSSPDPIRGEIVKAFVVLTPGTEGTADLIQALQKHVQSRTAPYKYPRAVEFVTELPKTISGKIRRVELREKEWQGVRRS